MKPRKKPRPYPPDVLQIDRKESAVVLEVSLWPQNIVRPTLLGKWTMQGKEDGRNAASLRIPVDLIEDLRVELSIPGAT